MAACPLRLQMLTDNIASTVVTRFATKFSWPDAVLNGNSQESLYTYWTAALAQSSFGMMSGVVCFKSSVSV